MDRDELWNKIVSAIQEVQETSGDSVPEGFGDDGENFCLGDIPHYDSFRGAEVASYLADDLDRDIEKFRPLYDGSVFDDISRLEEVTIDQAVDRIAELLPASEE